MIQHDNHGQPSCWWINTQLLGPATLGFHLGCPTSLNWRWLLSLSNSNSTAIITPKTSPNSHTLVLTPTNMVLLHHIPGLFVAFTQTFGGPPSFFNPKWCIQKYGLPDAIAESKSAQTMMVVSSARMTAIGLALFAFHFQHEYAAVDTLLICLGGYVC